MMTYDIYGIGNALVDIQICVDDTVLAQTGFDKGIMTLVDDLQQQQLLQQLSGLPHNLCAGGSAANTVVGLTDFGGRAAFCGKVSNDAMGDFFVTHFDSLGIATNRSLSHDRQTGSCAILITPDAQRTMLTNLGAAVTVAPEDIEEDKLSRSRYLYLEGYLLTGESSKAAAYHAMALAQRHGVKIALSASDPFLVNLIRDELWQLVEGPVDLFFCNEAEAKSLVGSQDIVHCAETLHRHTENVALTLGSKGSLIMHSGELLPIEGVDVEAVDTTGAGDLYAGALIYGISAGLSWKQAGHLASHAAARIVTQLGARLERPFNTTEIAALLN